MDEEAVEPDSVTHSIIVPRKNWSIEVLEACGWKFSTLLQPGESLLRTRRLAQSNASYSKHTGLVLGLAASPWIMRLEGVGFSNNARLPKWSMMLLCTTHALMPAISMANCTSLRSF